MADMSKKERKRLNKMAYHAEARPKASSSTPGRSKGLVASALQRGVCRRNRSHKRPDYKVVIKTLGKRGNAK